VARPGSNAPRVNGDQIRETSAVERRFCDPTNVDEEDVRRRAGSRIVFAIEGTEDRTA